MHHTSPAHLICMRLASMLQGARGVTGTGMPCSYSLTAKEAFKLHPVSATCKRVRLH